MCLRPIEALLFVPEINLCKVMYVHMQVEGNSPTFLNELLKNVTCKMYPKYFEY